jgi:glycerophosphoryl diester phosphodiesterase
MPRPKFDRPIAHRGLHDRSSGIIENSASAFEAAIAKGYAIECDVQLSADGVPFVFHDDTLERLTGAKGASDALPIAEITQLQLSRSATGDRPQTFGEFISQIGGRVLLQIELKRQRSRAATETLASSVAHALRDYAGPHVVQSFDPRLIVALRRAGVSAPLGIITYGYDDGSEGVEGIQAFAARHLLHWPATQFEFISCQDTSLTLPAVRLFRSLGVPVTSWTITSPAAASAALKCADQIVFEGFEP